MKNNFWSWVGMGIDVVKYVGLTSNPILGGVLSIVEAVVEKKADGISDNSVVEIVHAMGKSTLNSMDNQCMNDIEEAIQKAKDRAGIAKAIKGTVYDDVEDVLSMTLDEAQEYWWNLNVKGKTKLTFDDWQVSVGRME